LNELLYLFREMGVQQMRDVLDLQEKLLEWIGEE
jgi:hypothetical protein